MITNILPSFIPACGRSRMTDVSLGVQFQSGGEYTNDLDGASSILSSGGDYAMVEDLERVFQSYKDDVVIESRGGYAPVSVSRESAQSTKGDVLISSSGEYAIIGLQQANTQSTKDDVLISSSGLYNRI